MNLFIRAPIDMSAFTHVTDLPDLRGRVEAENPTVLVVQSDPYISAVLWAWLSRCGFRVVCETSGPAGRQLARSLSPDAVVLDVNMPQLNGLEICRQLKTEPETCAMPVIFCSEQSYLADEALESGAAAFLSMPDEISKVPGSLRAVLAARV